MTVNVLGFQWQWQFTYEGERLDLPAGQPPEDLTIKGTIAKPPVMYLPVGEPIRFNTEAQDVIHSFYVREFLFKRDAFPGHVNTFDLTITKPGDYGGQCTEYCGLAHQAMRFTIRAVPRPSSSAWLVKAKKRRPAAARTTPTRAHRGQGHHLQQGLPVRPVNRRFEISSTTRRRCPTTSPSSRAGRQRPPILPEAETPVFPGPRRPPTSCPR